MKKKQILFSFLVPGIPLASELIRVFIRPIYGQEKYGLISNILGWLPNFLAGFGLMLLPIQMLVLIDYVLVNKESKKATSRRIKWIIFFLASSVSLGGLILHEIDQKGPGGLYYDVQDIYATVVGVVLGSLVYYNMLLRKKKKLFL